jgi:hypothetical protein
VFPGTHEGMAPRFVAVDGADRLRQRGVRLVRKSRRFGIRGGGEGWSNADPQIWKRRRSSQEAPRGSVRRGSSTNRVKSSGDANVWRSRAIVPRETPSSITAQRTGILGPPRRWRTYTAQPAGGSVDVGAEILDRPCGLLGPGVSASPREQSRTTVRRERGVPKSSDCVF